MPILGLFIEDDEYYQAMRGTFPQPTAPPVNLTKSEPSEEVKILANRMAQLKFSLKEKSAIRSHDYIDLLLFKDEPFPEDFKLPNFTKFNGTSDPRVHLRQYTTFMASTKLTESQIVKFFFTLLEEGPRAWFFDLEDEIKNDWMLLT